MLSRILSWQADEKVSTAGRALAPVQRSGTKLENTSLSTDASQGPTAEILFARLLGLKSLEN